VTALGIASLGWADATSIVPPTPREVAQGVWLIPGAIIPNREPDGNTVIFDAPEGLIVVDTGRHEWHHRAILALASDRRKPIKIIVNTHWHLDHVSGNPAIRAAFPGLRVYGSGAINNALTGFLASSASEGAGYIDDPALPEEMRAVPGHGAPMVRAQLSIYRQAFDSFVACSNSARLKDECAAGWATMPVPCSRTTLARRRAPGQPPHITLTCCAPTVAEASTVKSRLPSIPGCGNDERKTWKHHAGGF
jgi:hypothetical protein